MSTEERPWGSPRLAEERDGFRELLRLDEGDAVQVLRARRVVEWPSVLVSHVLKFLFGELLGFHEQNLSVDVAFDGYPSRAQLHFAASELHGLFSRKD